MGILSPTGNLFAPGITFRVLGIPVVFDGAIPSRMAILVWVFVLMLVISPRAYSVYLPNPGPGQLYEETVITGTTVAARPELAGYVIKDVITPYEFSGSTDYMKGVVQNRVVLSSVDDTFDFYWRITPDRSSTRSIKAFRVSGFEASPLDADWRIDGVGVSPPEAVRNFGHGKVNFIFPELSVPSGANESRFFFLDTEAKQYAMAGAYDLACSGGGCLSSPFSTFAPVASPDLAVVAIGGLKQIGIRPWRGAETPNIQGSHYGGDPAPGGSREVPIVGFTLYVTAKNVSTDPDDAGPMSASSVPWFFPVVETPANPWIVANSSLNFSNGFTGQEGGMNHMHDQPPQSALPSGHALEVGLHPHIIHRIFRKPIGGSNSELIGHSDLKHTYLFGPPALHESRPGYQDSYTTPHNQDQSFYSSLSEINSETFMVAAHEHMGSVYPQLGLGYHRDHGELEFSGSPIIPADDGHPGINNIDHILQARVDRLKEPGFCHYLAGTYYVVDDVDQEDFDNSNNTFWRQFSPRWDGVGFDPVMLVDSGKGLDTIDSHVCTQPRNASIELTFIGKVNVSTLAGIEVGQEINGSLKIDPDLRDQDDDPRIGRFEEVVLPAQFEADRLHFIAALAGYTIVLDTPFPIPPGPDPSPMDSLLVETVYDDALNDMVMGDLHDPVMGSDTDLDLGLGSLFRTSLEFEAGTLVGGDLSNLPLGHFDVSGNVLRLGQFEIINHEGEMLVSGRISSLSIASTLVPGDANGDGLVDVEDMGILGANFNMTGMQFSDGDFNSDGVVDVSDLAILGANWSSARLNASVPEPATLSLLAMSMLIVGRRRRA